MEREQVASHLVEPQEGSRLTSPSMREILALEVFAGAELLSGQSRLDEPVTWVHVSELLNAWRFLSGGELLLSTGLELARANPEVRLSYLRSLVEAGTQGLVLELVQWLSEVPPDMLQTARLMEFPLIVFSEEVRFADLTRAAHQLILGGRPPSLEEPALDALVGSLVETGRSAVFVEAQLAPLLALPGRPRGTLLATLEALLASQFNITQTARRLGVRRQRLLSIGATHGDAGRPGRAGQTGRTTGSRRASEEKLDLACRSPASSRKFCAFPEILRGRFYKERLCARRVCTPDFDTLSVEGKRGGSVP